MLNRSDLYKDGCLIIKNIDTVQFHKRVLWLKPRECFDIIQGFFLKVCAGLDNMVSYLCLNL